MGRKEGRKEREGGRKGRKKERKEGRKQSKRERERERKKERKKEKGKKRKGRKKGRKKKVEGEEGEKGRRIEEIKGPFCDLGIKTILRGHEIILNCKLNYHKMLMASPTLEEMM